LESPREFIVGTNDKCASVRIYEIIMRVHIKLTGRLYNEIIQDLVKPHPFAAERVGFVLGRMVSLENEGKQILLIGYYSIPDEHYIDDPTVGARIGSQAMAWAMAAAHQGRAAREGVFHIHLHDNEVPTGISRTDRADLPKLMPGFQSVSREAAHGILILSRNHGSGWVWLPGNNEAYNADSIQIIGAPVSIFNHEDLQ
jgi:hypothetical protein